jgi:hypothetical protein
MQTVSPPKNLQTTPLDLKSLQLLQQRMGDLLERDWQDAEAGIYPKELLFDNPWDDFFRFYPLVCLDLPKIWERLNNRDHHRFLRILTQLGIPNITCKTFTTRPTAT